MKRIFLLVPLVLFSFYGFSQSDINGLWQGKLNVGVELSIVFHISGEKDQKTATFDVPEQGAKDLKTSAVRVTNDSLVIEIAMIKGSFKGKRINDSTIQGEWFQGATVPLTLKRITQIAEVKRPQTPQPPFPYQSEDLVYYNKDSSIRYGATLTLPKGKGPFPAILLITGSGQQNRDEEIFNHHPFAVIADHLTKNGYAVLRVDDRGMGTTTGEVANATTRDFANDAIVGIQYLEKRKEIDKKKIGLLGHSEGGMIAEMLAAERNDIAFIILLGAPGEKTTDLMLQQNEALYTGAGLPKQYVDAYLVLYKALVTTITNISSKEEARTQATKFVTDWVNSTPKEIVLATTGISDEASKQKFVDGFLQFSSPWFTYFMHYDPDPVLRKITSKVLALNGEKDVQVISKANLDGIRNSLSKGKSAGYEVKEMPGLNHLFQHCNTCLPMEYGQIEQTIAPEVLDVITAWLKKNVQ
jgi:uncharacterized protein